MEAIYDAVEADTSLQAFAWFERLAQAVYSLERFPNRGTSVSGSKKLRHLLFGKRPSVFRIIYVIDKGHQVVNVLHIRHAARAAPSLK
jgi:plasmid stabilization system protein ParE